MGGVFESFESDLSSAPTKFWICGHQEGSKFENDVFAHLLPGHVLVSQTNPLPSTPSKRCCFDASAPEQLADFFSASHSPSGSPYDPYECGPKTLKMSQKPGFGGVFWPILTPFLGGVKMAPPPHHLPLKKVLVFKVLNHPDSLLKN